MEERITVATPSIDKVEKLRELVNKTHKDDPNSEDLAELRLLFDEDPDLWRTTGNMARRTLDHLLRTYYPQTAYLRECISPSRQGIARAVGLR